MVEQLDKISDGVCDGSSSTAKSFRDIVQTHSKHTTVGLQKDIWHKESNIVKKWNEFIKSKTAEELKGKLTALRLKRWFYTCAKNCGGSGATLQNRWLGAATHW